MKRFVEGAARDQGGLFPVHLEDFVATDFRELRMIASSPAYLSLGYLGSYTTKRDTTSTRGRLRLQTRRTSCIVRGHFAALGSARS